MVNQSGVTGYGRTIQSAGDVSSHQESEISPLLAQSISKVQNVVTLLKKDSQQSEIDSHVEEGIFSKLWSWTNQKMYTAVQYVQETFVPMEVVEESFADEQVDSRLPIQQDICLDEEWMPEKSEVEEDGDWKEAVESEWVKQETISRSEEPTSIAKEEESTSWSKTISSTLYSVLPRPATEEDEMRVDSLASVPPGIPDESEHQGLLSKAFEASLDGMQTTLTAASKMVQGVKQEAVKIAGKAAIKAFGYLGEFREEKKKLEADLLKIVKDEKVVRSISNIVSSPLHRLIDAVRKEPKLSSALSSSTTLVQEDGALSASGELMLFALEDSEIQCLLTNQLLHVTTEVYKIVDQIQAEMVLKFATDCLKNATKVPHESLISEEDFEGIASTEQMVRKIKENVVALLFPHGAQDIKLGAFSQIQEAQLLKEIVYERVEQGIGLLVTQITTQLVSVEMRQELAIQGAKLAADTIEGMVADKEGVVASAKKVLQTSSSSVANADAQQVVEFTHQLKQVTRALLQVVTSQKVAKKTGLIFDRFIDKIGPLLAERIIGMPLGSIMNSQIILAATSIGDLPIEGLLKSQVEKNKIIQERSSGQKNGDEEYFEQRLQKEVDRFMSAFTKFLPETKEIFQELLQAKILGSEQTASSSVNQKKATHHMPKWAQRALLRAGDYVIKTGLILFQKIVGSKRVSETLSKKITDKMATAIKNLNVHAITSSSVHASSNMLQHKVIVHVLGSANPNSG